MTNFEEDYLQRIVDFQPWETKSEEILHEQMIIQDVLKRRAGAKHIGRKVFIARGANVLTSHFSIGDNSWIASGVILRGSIEIGSNTTVNPYAHIAGAVKLGNGVRVAGNVAIYGFNHGFSRIDIPVYQQPITSVGIKVDDDVWIGTNSVILDGCSIGAHSIIAAGSVVTKSFPEYSIIGGNPARLIRDRRVAEAP